MTLHQQYCNQLKKGKGFRFLNILGITINLNVTVAQKLKFENLSCGLPAIACGKFADIRRMSRVC